MFQVLVDVIYLSGAVAVLWGPPAISILEKWMYLQLDSYIPALACFLGSLSLLFLKWPEIKALSAAFTLIPCVLGVAYNIPDARSWALTSVAYVNFVFYPTIQFDVFKIHTRWDLCVCLAIIAHYLPVLKWVIAAHLCSPYVHKVQRRYNRLYELVVGEALSYMKQIAMQHTG